jgi:hypothetical protein
MNTGNSNDSTQTKSSVSTNNAHPTNSSNNDACERLDKIDTGSDPQVSGSKEFLPARGSAETVQRKPLTQTNNNNYATAAACGSGSTTDLRENAAADKTQSDSPKSSQCSSPRDVAPAKSRFTFGSTTKISNDGEAEEKTQTERSTKSSQLSSPSASARFASRFGRNSVCKTPPPSSGKIEQADGLPLTWAPKKKNPTRSPMEQSGGRPLTFALNNEEGEEKTQSESPKSSTTAKSSQLSSSPVATARTPRFTSRFSRTAIVKTPTPTSGNGEQADGRPLTWAPKKKTPTRSQIYARRKPTKEEEINAREKELNAREQKKLEKVEKLFALEQKAMTLLEAAEEIRADEKKKAEFLADVEEQKRKIARQSQSGQQQKKRKSSKSRRRGPD